MSPPDKNPSSSKAHEVLLLLPIFGRAPLLHNEPVQDGAVIFQFHERGHVVGFELDYLAEPVTDLPRRSGLGLNRKVIDRDVVKFLAELPTWPVPRPLGLPPSRMSGRGEPGGAERVPLIQGVRIRDTQGHARSRAPGLDYLVDQVTYHRGCFPPEAAGMCVALPRRMAATRRRVGLSSKR